MLKKMLFLGLLAAVFVRSGANVLAAASEIAPLVGFIDEYDLKPLTTPGGNFGYNSGIALDYRSRSLVLDLGFTQKVTGIKLIADTTDRPAPKVNAENLEIYWSQDNVNYAKYNGALKYLLRAETGKTTVWTIELTDLSFFARYVKLHTTYSGEDYGFANRNTQDITRVYVDAGIPRISGLLAENILERNTNRIGINLDAGRSDLEDCRLLLELKNTEGTSPALQKEVPAAGAHVIAVDAGSLPAGKYDLIVSLVSGGQTTDVRKKNILLCNRILRDGDLKKGGRAKTGDAVILREFERWIPGELVSRESREGLWQYRKYRLEGPGVEGSILSDAGRRLPETPLDLKLNGWYAISAGLVKPCPALEIKLSGDRDFTELHPAAASSVLTEEVGLMGAGGVTEYQHSASLKEANPAPGKNMSTTEVFFRYADLTGRKIVLRGNGSTEIAYLKLVPLAANEISSLQETGGNIRRIIYNNDGHSIFFDHKPPMTREDVLHWVDIYRNQDVEILDWGLGLGIPNYGTKLGGAAGKGLDPKELPRDGDRQYIANVTGLIAEGNDPLKLVIGRAHETGLGLFASIRMNAYYPEPGECQGWTFDWSVYSFYNSAFYREHLNLRVADRNGRLGPQLSYAYPEVRRYYCAVAREAAEYGVDGITLDFLREPPFLGYEKPISEGFAGKYGEDPRKLVDPGDERWLRYRAGYLTGFLKDLRRELKNMEKRTGRRVKLAARIDHTKYFEQGLDVKNWVKEGLVDILIPSDQDNESFYPIGDFVRMTGGTGIKLYPCINVTLTAAPHYTDAEKRAGKRELNTVLSPEMYQRRALELYGAGADGIYIFNNGQGGGILGKLGDTAKLKMWAKYEDPLLLENAAELLRIP